MWQWQTCQQQQLASNWRQHSPYTMLCAVQCRSEPILGNLIVSYRKSPCRPWACHHHIISLLSSYHHHFLSSLYGITTQVWPHLESEPVSACWGRTESKTSKAGRSRRNWSAIIMMMFLVIKLSTIIMINLQFISQLATKGVTPMQMKDLFKRLIHNDKNVNVDICTTECF